MVADWRLLTRHTSLPLEWKHIQGKPRVPTLSRGISSIGKRPISTLLLPANHFPQSNVSIGLADKLIGYSAWGVIHPEGTLIPRGHVLEH